MLNPAQFDHFWKEGSNFGCVWQGECRLNFVLHCNCILSIVRSFDQSALGCRSKTVPAPKVVEVK